MKKATLTSMLCLLTCVFLLAGCGGGGAKYEDAKKVSEEVATAAEKYATAMDKASSADDVVKAMDSFTNTMKGLMPKLKEVQKKYPELEGNGELPPELKDVEAKMNSLQEKMTGAMMKTMTYMNDPKVKEAMERMQTAMAGMDK